MHLILSLAKIQPSVQDFVMKSFNRKSKHVVNLLLPFSFHSFSEEGLRLRKRVRPHRRDCWLLSSVQLLIGLFWLYSIHYNSLAPAFYGVRICEQKYRVCQEPASFELSCNGKKSPKLALQQPHPFKEMYIGSYFYFLQFNSRIVDNFTIHIMPRPKALW